MRFDRYMMTEHGICTLTVAVPCAKIDTTVLAQKHYRDIGERIARAGETGGLSRLLAHHTGCASL